MIYKLPFSLYICFNTPEKGASLKKVAETAQHFLFWFDNLVEEIPFDLGETLREER